MGLSRNVFRVLGIIVFAVGIVLLVLGIQSTNEFGEEMQETFTGHHSERTRSDIISGVVLIVAGIGMVALTYRRR